MSDLTTEPGATELVATEPVATPEGVTAARAASIGSGASSGSQPVRVSQVGQVGSGDVPVTGDRVVDDALTQLGDSAAAPIGARLEAGERLQRMLQARLDDAGED